jgi:hypothetical protein
MPESAETTTPFTKPKVRLSIKISLIISSVMLILMLIQALAFYSYLESGGLNTTCEKFFPILYFPSFFILFIVLFSLICIVISPFKKPKLLNFNVAITSFLIALVAWGIFIYSSNGFTWKENQRESVRYWAHNEMDFLTLNWIRVTLPAYTKDHEGKLPAADKWYKSLIDYTETSTDSNIKSSIRTTKNLQRRFAFNIGVSEMPLLEIDHNTVLIFETNYIFEINHAKELVGGPESITAEHQYGKGSVILFADMHIAFIRAEDFNNLRWKP